MSWSRGIQGMTGGGGAFVTFQPLTVSIGAIPDTGAEASRLRQSAREAFRQGRIADARADLGRLFALIGPAGAEADDILFHGLVLTAAGETDRAIAELRAGATRFPDNAAMHENIGVLLLGTGDAAGAAAAAARAVALGSDSPNALDCLADAHWRIGRTDEAVRYGRLALEAKDRRFGSGPRLVTVPDRPPPPFNPLNPDENVIAYTLWGNAERYCVPLLENARILPHLFPGWSIRVYHDDSVDPGYLALLRERGVALRPMRLPPGLPGHRRLLWRFEVAADPTVRRFLCRDADSLLTVKERVAIDAWIASPYPFHAMRDWFTHTDLLLAGMWGGIGGILPDVATLLTAYRGWRMELDHVDQDLLSEAVWPILRGHVLIHDSIFAPCLGSVPFPPFGTLPPHMHIGQNAFLHFRPAG